MTHGDQADRERADRERADRERAARAELLRAGAADLPRPPWLRPGQPPSAVDLVRFALWRAGSGSAADSGVLAAVGLLEASRAEVEQLETAALFTARAAGLSWARISQGLGLGSAQAAQQRFDRVTARVGRRAAT